MTGYECTVTVDHWNTFSEVTNTAEYHEDSGDIEVFKTLKIAFKISADFFSPKIGMVGWQIAHYKKEKHNCKNKRHAFWSSRQQQRDAPALELDDTVLIGEDGSHPKKGKYEDLLDGRHKKTKNVKTCTGRTVSIETGLNRDMESVKRQL